jgi:hypothetical protein
LLKNSVLCPGTPLVVPQLLENLAGLQPMRDDFLAVFEFFSSPLGFYSVVAQETSGKRSKQKAKSRLGTKRFPQEGHGFRGCGKNAINEGYGLQPVHSGSKIVGFSPRG